VEREQLEQWLGEGVSIEEIARRVGKHPSTVSYWTGKYGLRSSLAQKHTARGPLDRDTLAKLLARDMTIREIAAEVDRSPTTVRYWLRRHGLDAARVTRRRAIADARAAGQPTTVALCPRHGETTFRLREDTSSYRCLRCLSEQVTNARRRQKARLVADAGGRCTVCGYDRYLGALQFHHVDRETKEFSVSQRGLTRSFARALAEARKCVLLCANCHAEVEADARDLF
jgi:transposase/DNA-directed RNA polymerase subunit RPC12/RpoP